MRLAMAVSVGLDVLFAATVASADDKVQQGSALFTSQKCAQKGAAGADDPKK